MPSAGFEPAIAATKRQQTYALNRVFGPHAYLNTQFTLQNFNHLWFVFFPQTKGHITTVDNRHNYWYVQNESKSLVQIKVITIIMQGKNM
jgi:hypothetical protein